MFFDNGFVKIINGVTTIYPTMKNCFTLKNTHDTMDYIDTDYASGDHEIARFRVGYNVYLVLYKSEPQP